MRNKKALISLALVLPLALSSCNSEKYIDLYNYDIDFGVNYVLVSDETLINMINSEMQFFLFVHSNSCSHCQVADETFRAVMENSKYHNTVYMWEVSTIESYNNILKNCPGILNEAAVTPQFLIVDNGVLIKDIDAGRFMSEGRLKSTMKYYFEFSSLYSLTLNSAFEQFNVDFPFYTLFIYDGDNVDSLNKYALIYNEVKEEKNPTLFLNSAQIEDSLASNLSIIGVDYEKDSLYYIENLSVSESLFEITSSSVSSFVARYN
ncbi:MAG: hypothetical protein LUB56_02680 [Coprobacillus sp.]|nr:hypothetical protein [Coprobacillus sp.]